MKLNFAQQPDGGGMIDILTARDLTSDVVNGDGSFLPRPLFVDNCKNCGMNTKMGADGSLFGQIVDTAKYGVGIWSQQQQSQAATEQAQLALQIEQQKTAQEKADALAAQTKASTIKSYGLPIAIAGGVIVLGIATYFLLRKK